MRHITNLLVVAGLFVSGPRVCAQEVAMPANPPDDWPTCHLLHPGPGGAMPGDPNCAFYWIWAENTAGAGTALTDKTLVVWANPADLEQSGGSSLTLDDLKGRFDGIVFAENHGRMTWKDTTTFAPEAMIDGKGRQIMWAWLHDNPRDEKQKGWSGAMCLPRLLWQGADGALRMRPVPELNMLRGGEQSWKDLTLAAGETKRLDKVAGDSCERSSSVTAASRVLGNARIKLTVAGGVSLESVENVLAAETYTFSSDVFTLDTDLGVFSNRSIKPTVVAGDASRIEFRYEFQSGQGAAKDRDYFTKTIDTFAAIGGDMIIFKPLHPYQKPTVDRTYWDVVPDDPGAMARQICDYAKSKGISYGFYMGCAAHGGEGNAAGLNFRPDKPDWKKSDAEGLRAPDNCLACDDFYEWWFTVQNNTIQKYNLSNWSCDPSLGSGMNCYDESHGHFANQGGYKGWRRCIELMARLKAAKPGLFIQGFYGTKNFGLWGLKHVDQHEVLNEQSICVSTRHNQISDDRQNADGLRFQNNWSMRFRFTPAVMGHALTHRVSEGGFDPELIKAWDFYGWQYGVMSALAVSGSVMPTILPYQTDLVPSFAYFYRKWTRWARENFASVNDTEPFGEQVQPGAVDGYARIKGDHGFVFLFNGNPRPSRITFEVGDEINLQAKGDYEFAKLYPSEKKRRVLDGNGKSVFALGEKTSITVPPNCCYLLEPNKVIKQNEPVLVGAAGEVVLANGRMAVTGVAGKPGATAAIRVRELDAWTLADGKRFDFPCHAAMPACQLTSTFVLNGEVRQLLEKAKPQNFAEMDAKIADWQTPEGKKNGNGSYGYHNFICERPSRLWLILPFLKHTGVEVTLNGEKVEPLGWDEPSSSAFADVTDRVKYGGENSISLSINGMDSNRFMGPFLLYPEEAAADRVLPPPGQADPPVLYTCALVPALPPRYPKGEGPKVIEAKMMENVTLKGPAELRVKLDQSPEKIRRVMFFQSGFGWMGQENLGYNSEAGCWIAKVMPGNRAAIQENEFIYVWAEGSDGLRSDYHPVKVGWDFKP